MASDFPVFTKTFHTTTYAAIDPTNATLSAKDKVILITGGGRGIGKAIALSFATAGAKAVVILGRTQSTLEEATKDITAAAKAHGHDTTIRFYAVDICADSAVSTAFREVSEEFGSVDVVINNAGDLFLGTITECNIAEYWHSFEINVKGTLHCMQALLRNSTPERTSTFINVSTIGITMNGYPGWSAYGASKIAAFKMAKGMVAEVGGKVRVFSINPGRVATEMARKAGIPTFDDAELPGGFCVWLAATAEADFLQGRLVSCNWDVNELLGMREKIVGKDLLTMKLTGLDI
ncbi:putative short-chain dehydrogenase [Lophiotrema nucula]|uniref:Putative short-chain dehydrogenase n=1 Tax=Lophiotrema nucula TaxID=690887 RepID=A0A6A5Z7J5_9PLEO|nr:putative short-chain dehydrogenase [Lophiotrema nucula]